MLDPFLALDPLKNLRNFIGTLRWNQDGNRAALDLLGRIAKNPLGTRVPAQDNAVQGHANDGVSSGLHNRRQLGSCCPNLLALAHLTIGRARTPSKNALLLLATVHPNCTLSIISKLEVPKEVLP